jgi:ribosomal protein S7
MVSVKGVDLGWYYNERAIKVKNTKKEIPILRKAISKNVDTPYTYDRLSILLVKDGKRKEAQRVCEKCLKVIGGKSSGERRLLIG